LFCLADNSCSARSIPGSFSAVAYCWAALATGCYEFSRYERQNVASQPLTLYMAGQFGEYIK